MSAVTNAVSDVGDAISNTVSSVGDAVQNLGQSIVDDVVNPVVKAVDNTVKAIEKDPLSAAIQIGAYAMLGPAGLAIANGAIALSKGASIQDAALSAGKAYAVAVVGGAVGGEAGAAVSEAGYGAMAANAAAGAASGLTQAELRGGDAQTGAIMGGLGGLNASAAKAASDADLENWAQQQSANSYANSAGPTEQDVLAADPSIPIPSPLSTPTTATGPGYYDETTGQFIPDSQGALQAPLTDASGTNTLSPDTPVSGDGSHTPTDFTTPTDNTKPEAYDPLNTGAIKSGLGFAENAILNQAKTPTKIAPSAQSALNNPALAGLTIGAGSTGFTDPQFLDTSTQYLGPKASQPTSQTDQSPAHLQELKQLYASLTPEMAKVLADRTETPKEATTQDPTMTTTRLMASGGSTDSISNIADSLNPTSSNLGFIKPFAANMLPAAPLMSNQAKLNPLRHLQESLTNRQRTAGGLAHGGLPKKYADALPDGHKPEFITGLTGYYASGKGTGQSDDIDAMLHDGDYVADADLVAALGDGSSKAGAEALEKFRRQIPHQEHAVGGAAVPAKIADGEYVFPASFVTAIGQGDNKAGAKILDKMREAIRAHKRAAPTTKIPPKAKSPLEYLKMVKG